METTTSGGLVGSGSPVQRASSLPRIFINYRREDTEAAATNFVTGTQLFHLAESLGGVKSLVSHPASMTHKSIETEKRRAAGVSDSLIRLSVGLEDAEDLIDDIENALRKVSQPTLKLAPPLKLRQHADGLTGQEVVV